MQKSQKRIGEIMIDKGYITEAQLQEALREQKATREFLGSILVKNGWITARRLAEVLADQFNIPFVDIKREYIDMELARKFSSSLIVEHKCLPIRQENDEIIVAILNPLDAVAISKIQDESKPSRVKLVMASEEDMKQALQSYRKYVSDSIQRLLKRDKKPGE